MSQIKIFNLKISHFSKSFSKIKSFSFFLVIFENFKNIFQKSFFYFYIIFSKITITINVLIQKFQVCYLLRKIQTLSSRIISCDFLWIKSLIVILKIKFFQNQFQSYLFKNIFLSYLFQKLDFKISFLTS